LSTTVPPASEFLCAQKPVAHILDTVCLNVVVPQVGLDGRQPSQNFVPIIANRNVTAAMHVETIGVVGKS